jgi:hypothetical protein
MLEMQKRADALIAQARTALSAINRGPRIAGQAPDEGALTVDANHGAQCRQILESPVFQTFWAKAEAKLTAELLALPLDDDKGRARLAIAVQTQRSLSKWLLESTQTGRAAERELEKLRSGVKAFF